jgi:hypothetical protein
LSFQGQDLRNRSFRAQSLAGADFSGADLRGCDFRGATLEGALFAGARVGQSHRQQWQNALIAVFWAGLTGQGVSYLVFGCLGQPPGDPVWIFWVVLQVVLGLATLSTSLFLRTATKKNTAPGTQVTPVAFSQWRWHPWLLFPWVSATLILTLYLRLYPLHGFEKVHPLVNLGLGLGLGLGFFAVRRSSAVLLAFIAGGAVQTYGLILLWVVSASALLSTGHLGWGVLWMAGVLGLLGLSLWLWRSVLTGIGRSPGTQFDAGVGIDI